MSDPEAVPSRRQILRPCLEVVVLAGLPLASRATVWGGSPGATWPELAAVPVWLVAASAGWRAWDRAGRGAWALIALWVGAATTGTLVVLSEQHRPGSAVLAASLADALGSWFGAWSTTDPLYPLRSAAIYVAGPLFFVAARAIWNAERPPRLVEPLILWTGAAAAATAIVQTALGRGLSYESLPGDAAVGRAAGPLPDPNAFGSYLALVAAFGAVVWIARLGRRPDGPHGRAESPSHAGDPGGTSGYAVHAAAAAWCALVAGGLWVSGSRAAILSLLALSIAGLAARAVATSGGARIRLATAGTAVVAVVLGLVAVATLGDYGTVTDGSRSGRFLSALDLEQSSMRLLRGRPALWEAGATMVLDEPVAGVGAGRYGVELGKRLPADLWGATTAENAHNYYLQAAAETGLVGLVALGLLLFTVGVALWGNRGDLRARAALLGAGAWCLTCMTGHPQLIPSLQLFFWGFLGMVTAGYRLPRLVHGPTWLCVMLALLAGRAGQAVVAGRAGPALYAAGLHGQEPPAPGDEILRWTASDLRLDLRREGTVVGLRFLVPHERFPVTVRSGAGHRREERHFYEGGWKELAYYVPSGGSPRLRVSLETAPPFAAAGDPRDLGVMLAPVRFHRALREPVGTYAPEERPDGRSFRWTAGVACFPLARTDDLEIELRADHPDVEDDPVVVTLTRPGGLSREVAIADRDWRGVRIPGDDSAIAVLCVEPSRTWNPRTAVGSADSRDLGVAIAFPPGAVRP